MKSIHEKASELGNLKTWTAAVEVVNLIDLFEGNKNFTVFAPTDQAFAELERETIEELLQNTESLTATIYYHIVEGKFATSELPQRVFLRTLGGDKLIVDIASGLSVNHASIVQPNIECSNGIIHTIDKMLGLNRMKQTGRLATQPDCNAA